MNNKDLRKFICDNITSLSDNKINILYNYIKENNISHTENKNGLFINLSLCDEKHIHYFYEIITINDKEELKQNIIKDDTINNNKLKIEGYKKIIKKSKITKNINLTPIEKIILSYSFNKI